MDHHKQVFAIWHSLGLSEISKQLDTSEKGLSQAAAAARLKEYGLNQLPQKPPAPLWAIVVRQFRSPLIYILGLAAIVSVALGDVKDAGFIAGVLILNAVIGAYQEWKAEQSTHALRKLLQIRASVVRDGEVRELSAEEVVPGDIVWLEPPARPGRGVSQRQRRWFPTSGPTQDLHATESDCFGNFAAIPQR